MAVPVSDSFFRMLGVAPMIGRTFTADDPARGCSVVLSHRFWANTLGANGRIVGQTITLDRRPCTVVGVMPAGFAFYPEGRSSGRCWRPIFGRRPRISR